MRSKQEGEIESKKEKPKGTTKPKADRTEYQEEAARAECVAAVKTASGLTLFYYP